MPYLDHYDEPDEYLTSSSEAQSIDLPRRPPRAARSSSYDDRKRDHRQHGTPRRESRRRDSSYREGVGDSREKLPRSASRDQGRRERRPVRRVQDDRPDRQERRRSRADRSDRPDRPPPDPEREVRRERRLERRKSRAAEDPEREARRQARRQERRLERAAQDYIHEAQRQRKERQASRRLEREASPRKQPYVETTVSPESSRDVSPSKKPETDSSTTWTDEASQITPPPRQPVDDDYPDEGHSDYEQDYYQSSRRQEKHSPRRHSRRHHSRRRLPRAETWQSSETDWDYDLEKSSIDEKHQYPRSASMYDELKWYKRGAMPDPRSKYREERRGCCAGRRKCCTISIVVTVLIALTIIIAVAVVVSRNKFSYTPSTAQVNNTAAFTTGGATRKSVNDTGDGIGAGSDVYTYYQGKATQFPNASKWVSFEDMWKDNLANIQQSCGWLNYGTDDTDDETTSIYNAIQDRANASFVDHRLILALVLQESHGCVRVSHTTSSGGVRNTGLMQAHDGHEYDSKHSAKSILLMIQDGTQGTKKGDGLVQLLNTYGNPYEAARGYNSGYIPTSGDLSEAAGATACYVSDVANRLTGWVKATSTCPGSS